MKLSSSIFLILSFFILIGSASAASFSDNFNTGAFKTGWSTTGSPNFQFSNVAPTADGTYYAKVDSSGYAQYSYANYPFSNAAVWSFDIYATGGTFNSGSQIGVYFDANETRWTMLGIVETSDNNWHFRMWNDTYGTVGTYDSKFSQVSVGSGRWYHVNINKSGDLTRYWITIKDDTNTVISTQDVQIGNPIANADRIKLFIQGQTNGANGRWDNIYVATELEIYGIQFDATEYAINDIATITYKIDPDFWSAFYSYRIQLINDDTNYVAYTYDSIPQKGTFYFQPTTKASIRAELQKASFWGYLFGYDVLYTTHAAVGIYNSYIFVNNTVSVGILQNIQYRWGFTPSTLAIHKWITTKWYNPVTKIYEPGYSFAAVGTELNTLYTTQIIFGKEGTHVIELKDTNKVGVAASTLTYAVIAGGVPIENLTKSNITIIANKGTYATGDYLRYSYQIDYYNFTLASLKSIEIYNYGYNSYQRLEYAQAESGETNMYLTSIVRPPKAGASALRLTALNDSGRIVLASQDFTISEIDSDGYGLIVAASGCKGQKIVATVISPGDAKVKITTDKTRIYNITGTQDIPFILTTAASISVETGLDTQRKARIVEMDNCFVDDVVVGTTKSITDDFLASGMMITFIMLLLFAGIGFTIGGAVGAIVGFGSGFIFCAIYGFIPLWALFLFAILIIVCLGIVFGKNITGSS